MAILHAALLGIIQGLTEFLPVSSSAHLILARAFFGWDLEQFGLPFDVACHVGTLIAVLVYYWRDLVEMLMGLPRVFDPVPGSPQRVIWLLVFGTVPAVVAGLFFSDLIERLRTPHVTAVTLTVGALGLLVAERIGTAHRSERSIGFGESVLLGVAQASALVPGISRSGATLTVGMLLGLTRRDAARFSFLLGIPAILGAAAKEAIDLRHVTLSSDLYVLFGVGMVSSAIVGYGTVRLLIRYLTAHSLSPFAWYRLALAAAVVVWLFGRA